MVEQVIQWHESLPLAIKLVVDFFVSGVLVRGILARKVSVALEQLFSVIGARIKKWLIRNEKDLAIWLHYQNKAMNNGHRDKTPIECEQGKCQLFPPHKKIR